MAAKKIKTEQRGVSHEKCEASNRFVLVGTYKGDQLTKWRGWYNYPISDEELSHAETQRRGENELVTNCDQSLRARDPMVHANVINDDIHRFKEVA